MILNETQATPPSSFYSSGRASLASTISQLQQQQQQQQQHVEEVEAEDSSSLISVTGSGTASNMSGALSFSASSVECLKSFTLLRRLVHAVVSRSQAAPLRGATETAEEETEAVTRVVGEEKDGRSTHMHIIEDGDDSSSSSFYSGEVRRRRRHSPLPSSAVSLYPFSLILPPEPLTTRSSHQEWKMKFHSPDYFKFIHFYEVQHAYIHAVYGHALYQHQHGGAMRANEEKPAADDDERAALPSVPEKLPAPQALSMWYLTLAYGIYLAVSDYSFWQERLKIILSPELVLKMVGGEAAEEEEEADEQQQQQSGRRQKSFPAVLFPSSFLPTELPPLTENVCVVPLDPSFLTSNNNNNNNNNVEEEEEYIQSKAAPHSSEAKPSPSSNDNDTSSSSSSLPSSASGEAATRIVAAAAGKAGEEEEGEREGIRKKKKRLFDRKRKAVFKRGSTGAAAAHADPSRLSAITSEIQRKRRRNKGEEEAKNTNNTTSGTANTGEEEAEAFLRTQYRYLILRWLPSASDVTLPSDIQRRNAKKKMMKQQLQQRKDDVGGTAGGSEVPSHSHLSHYSVWRAVKWELDATTPVLHIHPKNFQVWNHRCVLLQEAVRRTREEMLQYTRRRITNSDNNNNNNNNNGIKTTLVMDGDEDVRLETLENWNAYLAANHHPLLTLDGEFHELELVTETLLNTNAKNYHAWLYRHDILKLFPFFLAIPSLPAVQEFLSVMDIFTAVTTAPSPSSSLPSPKAPPLSPLAPYLPPCPLQEELDFCMTMLARDPMNNSAWCHRYNIFCYHLLLPLLHQFRDEEVMSSLRPRISQCVQNSGGGASVHADALRVLVKAVSQQCRRTMVELCRREVVYAMSLYEKNLSNEAPLTHMRAVAMLSQSAAVRVCCVEKKILLLLDGASSDNMNTTATAGGEELKDEEKKSKEEEQEEEWEAIWWWLETLDLPNALHSAVEMDSIFRHANLFQNNDNNDSNNSNENKDTKTRKKKMVSCVSAAEASALLPPMRLLLSWEAYVHTFDLLFLVYHALTRFYTPKVEQEQRRLLVELKKAVEEKKQYEMEMKERASTSSPTPEKKNSPLNIIKEEKEGEEEANNNSSNNNNNNSSPPRYENTLQQVCDHYHTQMNIDHLFFQCLAARYHLLYYFLEQAWHLFFFVSASGNDGDASTTTTLYTQREVHARRDVRQYIRSGVTSDLLYAQSEEEEEEEERYTNFFQGVSSKNFHEENEKHYALYRQELTRIRVPHHRYTNNNNNTADVKMRRSEEEETEELECLSLISRCVLLMGESETLGRDEGTQYTPPPAVSFFLRQEATALLLAKQLYTLDTIRAKYWKKEIREILFRRYGE